MILMILTDYIFSFKLSFLIILYISVVVCWLSRLSYYPRNWWMNLGILDLTLAGMHSAFDEKLFDC